ncbi:MAG: histidine phosphatase family protein [Cyanobacteria bacterium SBLK]|nr:histidine phosphatase family protein [Cyanobacteria bacterium SBLK]
MKRTIISGLLLLSLLGCENTDIRDAPVSSPVSTPDATEEVKEEATGAIASDNSGGGLWSQLRQKEGHYFVLMRHALAPGTGDPANFRVDDCATQRNLSAEGREQARRTGEAFKAQGIVVDRVLSSQWCRCLETAQLLDIGEVEEFLPLNSFFRDRSKGPAQTAAIREFMRDIGDSPGVTVMVTHFVTVSAMSDMGVSSGAMVVMRVEKGDRLEVVGEIEAF